MAGGEVMVKVSGGSVVPPPGAGLATVTAALPAEAMSLAKIAAVNCVALTKVVVRLAPFQCTVEAVTNPEPFTVSVNAPEPASVLDGDSELIVGGGLLMVNAAALVDPPPGVGLNTVTFTVPPVAMSLAKIAAVNCVALTKVVVRPAPFQRTTEVETKVVPFTVNVKAAPPAVVLVGEMLVSVGKGLLMVKVCGLEVPPPGVGLNMVTLTLAPAATSLAEIAAVNCVALTKVVVRPVPFQRTCELEMNFEPVTVSVKAAPPAFAPVGEMDVRVGTGF